MNLESQLIREFERMAAAERPSPALWERVRTRTVMTSLPGSSLRRGALRLALALSLVLGLGYVVVVRQQAFRNLLTASSVPGDPTDWAGRVRIQPAVEPGVGGEIAVWHLPTDDYLLRVSLDIPSEQPALDSIEWTLTSQTCRDWSAASEIVFKDQLAIPTAGRPGTSLIVPRTPSSGLPLSAQFFGIAGRKRGDMLGCVDLPLGQAPGLALEAPVQTAIGAIQGSSVSGSADLWPGPNGERLVSADVQISKLDELPARTDGSRLLVWHLTRGTCGEWSPAAPPLTKDALAVPTTGTASFTLLVPSNVPSDAAVSLQLLSDRPNSIGVRIGRAEVQS